MQQSYMMELETEVAKLKERNEELQRKQVYSVYGLPFLFGLYSY
jgi:hypothetical protein